MTFSTTYCWQHTCATFTKFLHKFCLDLTIWCFLSLYNLQFTRRINSSFLNRGIHVINQVFFLSSYFDRHGLTDFLQRKLSTTIFPKNLLQLHTRHSKNSLLIHIKCDYNIIYIYTAIQASRKLIEWLKYFCENITNVMRKEKNLRLTEETQLEKYSATSPKARFNSWSNF